MTRILGNTTAFMDYSGEHQAQAGRPAYHLESYELIVVASPTDDFTPGASFPLLDFVVTLTDGLWPQMFVVSIKGVLYWVKGPAGVIVDEEGKAWRPSGFKLVPVKEKVRKQ